MHPESRGDEDNNPFPGDKSYQNNGNSPALIKIEKIPLRIYSGRKHFNLRADAGESLESGIYCGRDLCSLEEGIGRVMRACRQNALSHLRYVSERLAEPTGEEELAGIIANYQGSLKDLFYLVYPKSCGKIIEKQLGKYSNLEKKVIDNHKE